MVKIYNPKQFLVYILIGAVAAFAPFYTHAQVLNKGEDVEQLWKDNAAKWAQNFIKTVHTDKKDFGMFLKYNETDFFKDRGDFFMQALYSNMSKVQVTQFFASLNKKYLPLFKQFLYVKNNYPSTLAQYTANNNNNNTQVNRPVSNSCNVACYNVDCSLGSLDGWNAYYATNQSTTSSRSTSALVGGPCGPVTQSAQDPNTGNTYQVRLMSGSGVDPVCGPFIPVAPPMGNYSIRIGDSTNSGLGVAEASYSFIVNAANPLLTIQYAVVLENPPGHPGWTQPWFLMEVVDSLGNPISVCGQYSVVATSNLPGFKGFYYPPSGDTCYCKSWTTVYVPLRSYIGHCVTAYFEASDCAYGAHFGYAYVACSCGSPGVISSSPAFCGQSSITLTAPPGAATYTWSGPCISGANNQQTCTVTCPGTYQVIVVSTAGPSCDDTLSITIPNAPGPPPVPDFSTDTVCSGTPTQFTNLSNPLTGPNVKFYWDFYNNNHFEDSTTNPTWIFPVGGVYYVHLHELNNGCGMDTTIKVIVDSSHIPLMSAYGACTGSPAYFSNLSGPGQYLWNFGDPNCPSSQDTSSAIYTNHLYSQPGTYTVTLKTINTHCPDSAQQVITITQSPTESITLNATCGSPVVTFNANDSTNILEYWWTFYGANGNYIGSWFSLTSATASFTFPSANSSYQVVLTAYSNPNFCPGTDTLKFTLGYDTARFNIKPPLACLGKSTMFVDSSSGTPAKWYWDFGDPGSGPLDTSSVQDPTHKYNNTGTYNVKLVVTSASGCADSITKTVTLNPVAVADFNGDSVCFGDSTQFTDLSTMLGGGNLSGWSWNFGDPPSGPNNTSTSQNPAHKFSGPGTYTITLTAKTSAGCDSTITKTVQVYATPTPKFTVSKTCLGDVTQFTDNSVIVGGNIISWLWNFGDGGTSGIQNPSHTYALPGLYNATLVVISNHGCVDSVREQVRVNPLPAVAFKADTMAGCTPLCVKFTDLSTISSTRDVNWSWNLGTPADTSSAQNPTICYPNSGQYTIQLTVTSDSGCKSSQTVNNMITVYGHPVASITASSTVVDMLNPVITFAGGFSLDTITQYKWIFSDDSVFNSRIVTRTFADTGQYCTSLEVFDRHGCGDSTNMCIDVKALYTFYIPNAFSPNHNGLNDVFMPKGTYVAQYEMYIFDRWGNMLFHTTSMDNGWDGTVNHAVCEEDAYVYLINVTDAIGKKHSYIGRVSLLR